MKKCLLIFVLVIPFYCFGQNEESNNDSVAIKRNMVDSLLNELKDKVRGLHVSDEDDELTRVLRELKCKLDSLNLVIDQNCDGNKNKSICSTRDYITKNTTNIKSKLDSFTFSLRTRDDFSTYKWTKEDSILILDLKNTYEIVRKNLISKVSIFNDDLKRRINNYLSTEDYEWDQKRIKWEDQQFGNELNCWMVKLHILTKKRGIQRLEVQLLDYLLAYKRWN